MSTRGRRVTDHGMARLGVPTLMAADGADENRRFEAALSANAFWYPARYRQLAVWLETKEGKGVDEVEPQRLVACEVASGSGFQAVRRSLVQAGLLPPAPNAGVGGR